GPLSPRERDGVRDSAQQRPFAITPHPNPLPEGEGTGCWRIAAVLLVSLLGFTTIARAQQDAKTGMMKSVRFDQNLDAQVPLDLPVRDEQGNTVTIGDYLGKKPAVLTLVYYRCPMLCNEVLNTLLRSLNALSLEVGKQFDVITVSIDPKETPALAAQK